MVRFLIPLAVLAAPAVAQPFPSLPAGQPDVFLLERLEDGYATLTYSNSIDQTSGRDTLEMSHDGLAITVRVVPGGEDIGYAERLTVIAPPGWIAVPETVDVMDGESFVVELFRGGLGM